MILAGKFRSLLTTFGDHSFRNFCELGKPMKSIRIRNSKLQIGILKLWILKRSTWLADFATRCPCWLLMAVHTVYLKTSGKIQIWKIRNLILFLKFRIRIFKFASDVSVLFQKRWKECGETSPAQLIWAEMILAEKWFYFENSESTSQKLKKWY